MSQMGFFDADKRLSILSLKGDPLEAISKLMPWEMFRADIESVVLPAEESRKSKAGRKPIDALVLLRMLVLQSLYRAPRTMGLSATYFRWNPTFRGFGVASSAPCRPLDAQAGA